MRAANRNGSGSATPRARAFDAALRPWIAAHHGATVVELAGGLETDFHRCDDGAIRWLCVDVPESLAMRGRFHAPSDRCTFLAQSPLDLSWLGAIDRSAPVFVTAQGLFRAFDEADVRRLVTSIVEALPEVQMMFDSAPGPIDAQLRSWSPRVRDVSVRSYGYLRALPGLVRSALAGVRTASPCIVHVRV